MSLCELFQSHEDTMAPSLGFVRLDYKLTYDPILWDTITLFISHASFTQ